jgi:hypothetical protein
MFSKKKSSYHASLLVYSFCLESLVPPSVQDTHILHLMSVGVMVGMRAGGSATEHTIRIMAISRETNHGTRSVTVFKPFYIFHELHYCPVTSTGPACKLCD